MKIERNDLAISRQGNHIPLRQMRSFLCSLSNTLFASIVVWTIFRLQLP